VLTTASDEIGAAAQVAAAETMLNRSRQLYFLARVKLRQHLGLDEKEPLVLIAPENPKGQELSDVKLLQQEALVKRAELKAVQTSWERAGFLLELVRLAARNGVTLGWIIERNDYQAGLAWTNQTGSDGLSGEWRFNGNLGWIVTEETSTGTHPEWGALKLTYKWNLADHGVRRERIKQAELVLAQADEERKKQVKSVGYDLLDAYYNLQNQYDRLQSGALQLQYMQTLHESTLAKMRVGLASAKEVLDAQLLLQTAESDYERIQAELYLAGVNLKRAAGALNATAL
jgi:outer membrane protein TolC